MWWKKTVLFTAIFIAGVYADYTFTFELQSFNSSSPLERTFDQACCICCEDPTSSTCPSLCNTTLLICIRDAGHDENDNSCPRGALIVPVDSSTSGTMEFSNTFTGPWMDEIQVLMTIFHYDESEIGSAGIGTVASQRLIDFFIINALDLSPSDPPTPTVTFPGLFQRVLFSGTFHVKCAPSFFGPDCAMMCESRDDSLGHFTCDPVTGLRVCLEGYVDVGRNCTECVPSSGCSLLGGFCEEPGECRCRDGFAGDNCSESINGSLPAPSGFISATATIQTATRFDNNVFISTAGLPLVSAQSTLTLQSPFTSLASVTSSFVLELPFQTPTLSVAPDVSVLSVQPTFTSVAPDVSVLSVQPTFTSVSPDVSIPSLPSVHVSVPSGSAQPMSTLDISVQPTATVTPGISAQLMPTSVALEGSVQSASPTPTSVILDIQPMPTRDVFTSSVQFSPSPEVSQPSPDPSSQLSMMTTLPDFPLVSTLPFSSVISKTDVTMVSRTDIQNTPIVTPDVDSNRVDEGSDRLLYIATGAAAGGAVVLLVSVVAFMIIMIAVTRKYRKRKALKEQQQRNESRYTDVISNIEASSRFTSNTTLNKIDLDTVVTPATQDPITTLPRPTYSTFHHEDSGILTQETSEEAEYATPFVITNSGAQTPDLKQTKKDHEYAVLECVDLTKEGANKPEESIMDETDLLGSIERTMLQINKELEEEDNMVSAESDFSFIYADHDSEECNDNDSGLHNASLSPVSISN